MLNSNDHFPDEMMSNKRFLRQKRKKDDYLYVPESYIVNRANGLRNGRWTLEEHERFIRGVFKHGNNWKEIAKDIQTRNCPQARSHGQKFFNKLMKVQIEGITKEMCNVKYLHKNVVNMNEDQLKRLIGILLHAHVQFEKLDEVGQNILEIQKQEDTDTRIITDKSILINFPLDKNFEEDKITKSLHQTTDMSVSSLLLRNRSFHTLTEGFDFSDDEEILINKPNEYTYEHIVDLPLNESFNASDKYDSDCLYDLDAEATEKFIQLQCSFPSSSNQKHAPHDHYYEMMKSKMFSYMKERGEIREEEAKSGIFQKILLLIKVEEEKCKSPDLLYERTNAEE